MATATEQILSLLPKPPKTVSPQHIVEVTGLKENTVYGTLHRLMNQGKALRSDYGEYSIKPRSRRKTNGAASRADIGGHPGDEIQRIIEVIDSVEFRAGAREPLVEYVDRTVKDSRRSPMLPGGGRAHYLDTLAPNDALRSRGIRPGDPLDIQPCLEDVPPQEAFMTQGIYVVHFDGTPDLYSVSRTPGGGFAFKSDDFTFFIDPNADSETGWVDRDTGLPSRFGFVARLLRSTQTFAPALHTKREA